MSEENLKQDLRACTERMMELAVIGAESVKPILDAVELLEEKYPARYLKKGETGAVRLRRLWTFMRMLSYTAIAVDKHYGFVSSDDSTDFSFGDIKFPADLVEDIKEVAGEIPENYVEGTDKKA